MARLLELSDARARATIVPEEGAALGAFDALTGAGPVAVLDADGPGEGPVFRRASQVLAPFSNRLSAGGFEHEGVFHAVEPNVPGERRPIHGDAFARPWRVDEADVACAVLTLEDGAIGPWRYRAEVTYALEGGTLRAELTLTNDGPALPFGGGFHPWFVREPGAAMEIDARGVWLQDERHLPARHVPLDDAAALDHRTARAPRGWINNAYTGWSGTARLTFPASGITATLRADTDCIVAYTPRDDAPFLCMEPVTHPVDAANLPGRPGLVVLGHGETMRVGMAVGWHHTGQEGARS